jgi:sterol desaturase/sphingolipid hydroxylase (fatty acid hydroxylase superfamily)
VNQQKNKGGNGPYVATLLLCLLLFSARVVGQLVQHISPVAFLPPFEAWQGSGMPYSALLTMQLVIVAAASFIITRLAHGRITPNPRTAAWLYWLGIPYFIAMLVRLLLGLGPLHEAAWFAASIPAFFHIVLASMVLTLAHYHSSPAQRLRFRQAMRWAVYPGIMGLVVLAYYGLIAQGVSPVISSYVSGLLAAITITIAEILLPYRAEWRPTRHDILHDSIFLLLIQVVLPNALTLLAAIGLQHWVVQSGIAADAWWPHHYPIWAQMLLMMFAADFLRYWLHRAFHTYHRLWPIHAVHHSVQKLYWLNVGRFHPLDKSLQFLADVLPFIFLGVSQEVLTLYFVVYSVKGFFQHSNVDVRLGWLNYLISGPELHRWHHSKIIRESNSNYGNNISVWDWLFGTFHYPKAQEVGDLGLFNRHYPMAFLSQMRAPFVRGLDKEAK